MWAHMQKNTVKKYDHSGLKIHTRSGGGDLGPYEKPVILPDPKNNDVMTHAWADARFVTDIMAEHAFFFTLLMPPEVARHVSIRT